MWQQTWAGHDLLTYPFQREIGQNIFGRFLPLEIIKHFVFLSSFQKNNSYFPQLCQKKLIQLNRKIHHKGNFPVTYKKQPFVLWSGRHEFIYSTFVDCWFTEVVTAETPDWTDQQPARNTWFVEFVFPKPCIVKLQLTRLIKLSALTVVVKSEYKKCASQRPEEKRKRNRLVCQIMGSTEFMPSQV